MIGCFRRIDVDEEVEVPFGSRLFQGRGCVTDCRRRIISPRAGHAKKESEENEEASDGLIRLERDHLRYLSNIEV